MTRQLPSNPNLEHLRKEAKDLLKAHKAGDPSCCEVLRNLHQFKGKSDEELLTAKVSLVEVQFALAIDYQFENWAELKSRLQEVLPGTGPYGHRVLARQPQNWPDLLQRIATLSRTDQDYAQTPNWPERRMEPEVYADLEGNITGSTFTLSVLLKCPREALKGTDLSSLLSFPPDKAISCQILRGTTKDGEREDQLLVKNLLLHPPSRSPLAAQADVRVLHWHGQPTIACHIHLMSGPDGEVSLPWPPADPQRRQKAFDQRPWDATYVKEMPSLPFFVTDKEGRILELSVPMLVALEEPESQLLGRAVWDIIRTEGPESLREFVRGRIADDIAGKTPHGINARIHTVSGFSFSVRVFASHALWHAKEVVAFQIDIKSEAQPVPGQSAAI